MWPAAFGLGNEKQYYLPAAQWAGDSVTMYELVQEIFGPAASDPREVPGTYGPCNSGSMQNGGLAEWSLDYLNNITAKSPHALDAFTFHGWVASVLVPHRPPRPVLSPPFSLHSL